MIELKLGAQDDGRKIDLPSGETLRIQLAESPTTGYRWQVEAVDPEIVASGSSQFTPAAPATAGGGGTRVFELQARQSGTTRVRFTLRREWEKSGAPQAQFEVAIHVT